eukprot:1984365-Pyramimonas_sp.AAC.1
MPPLVCLKRLCRRKEARGLPAPLPLLHGGWVGSQRLSVGPGAEVGLPLVLSGQGPRVPPCSGR